MNLIRYAGNSPIQIHDNLGLWKIAARSNIDPLVDATSEKGDTIESLAKKIFLNVNEYKKWLTASGKYKILINGKVFERTIDSNGIGTQNKWCPGQKVRVPNTVLAAYFLDDLVAIFSKKFSADNAFLKGKGIYVPIFDFSDYAPIVERIIDDNGREREVRTSESVINGILTFKTTVQQLASNKQLWGLHLVAHGSTDGKFGARSYPTPALISYQEFNITVGYGLGIFYGFACNSNVGEPIVLSNAIKHHKWSIDKYLQPQNDLPPVPVGTTVWGAAYISNEWEPK
jgi:hypothetical protein